MQSSGCFDGFVCGEIVSIINFLLSEDKPKVIPPKRFLFYKISLLHVYTVELYFFFYNYLKINSHQTISVWCIQFQLHFKAHEKLLESLTVLLQSTRIKFRTIDLKLESSF